MAVSQEYYKSIVMEVTDVIQLWDILLSYIYPLYVNTITSVSMRILIYRCHKPLWYSCKLYTLTA